MSYGRRERGRPRARRASYLRDVRYEVAKDGVGRATEFVGAGIGFAVGLTAARYGMPLPSTLAAGGGAGLGVLTALTGKAFITVGIDRVKDQRGAAPDGTVGEHIASIRVVRQRIHRQRRRLHRHFLHDLEAVTSGPALLWPRGCFAGGEIEPLASQETAAPNRLPSGVCLVTL